MNGIKYKLSIIVPTYNGEECISDTLDSVLTQLEEFSDKVEFIVRDNCSTDSTQHIVSHYCEKYPGLINYQRRLSTVDADTNYREAINMSKGEYVLLLGDDDLLFPNFILLTLRLLARYSDIGLLYYNRISTSRLYEGALLKHKDPNNTFVKQLNIQDFISLYPSGPDFISVNVTRKECLQKGFSYSKKSYYGVEWYANILFGLNGYKCLSCFCPMVLQRVPNKRIWNDRALLYVVVGMDNLFSDVSSLYPNAYNAWQSYSNEKVNKFSLIFHSIPYNRALYKEKWNELKEKLTKKERLVAYLIIHYPVAYHPLWFFYRAIHKMIVTFSH